MQGRSDPNAELLDAGALCRHLVADGSVYAFLADHRQTLFPDELFADLFPSGRGRPSVPADVIATVMVLQALEGLSDRDAADALRTNIAWKVSAGLALDDEGINYSVLTYWRSRLRVSDRPERIFEVVREVIAETGVLKGKTRRALDSTLLDDAVATQDTVTQLVAAIRRVRRLVPAAATIELGAHDYDASGKPRVRVGRPETRRTRWCRASSTTRSWCSPRPTTIALDASQADAVGLLALVAGQDVEPGDSAGSWRIAERVAPDRIISTVDPQARHMHKSRSEYRDGYKAHIAVEPETGLVTATALTPANVGDGPTGVSLLAGEASGLQVLADSAYGSGEVRAALRERVSRPGDQSDPVAAHGPRRVQPRRLRHRSRRTHRDVSRGSHRPDRHQRRRDVRGPLPRLRIPPSMHRHRRTAESSRSATTTSNSSKHVEHGATATSPTTIGDGDPWSNDPSPGSSRVVIAASATAASTATNTHSPSASPRSTSDDSSTSASPTDPPAGP